MAVHADDTLKRSAGVCALLSEARERGCAAVGGELVIDEGDARGRSEVVFLLEQELYLTGLEFAGQVIGLFLDDSREGNLEAAGEIQFETALDDPCDAALARLGVDADDGLIGAANISGVEREVGELPWAFVAAAGVFANLEALLDCVLVGPGEGADDELAAVGRTWVHGDFGAVFNGVNDGGDVGEVDIGVDALGVEVECEGDKVNITGAFAVAEETTFDTVSAGHLGKFGGCNGAAPVVMWVQGDANFLTLRDVSCEVLDLVGVDIRGGHFDGCGEVKYDGVGFGGLPGGLDGLADADGKIETGIREGLGREFIGPFGPLCLRVILGERADELGAAYCESEGLLLGHPEDDPTEAF